MSEKSLYSVFKGGLQDAKNKGKNLVGYVVDDYNGTLQSLQYVKTVVKDKIVAGETQNMASQSYTTLGSLGISGAMDDNGFIVINGGISYQAACNLKGYMSFPVNYKSGGSEQQNVSYVSVPATDSHVKSGVPLEKSGTAFPPTVGTPSENISWAIEANEECIIGVGLSVLDFAPKFFNNFFPFTDNRTWKQKNIQDLASKGYLYAEVLVPKSETSAHVLHSRVTINYGQSGESITTGLGEQTAKYDVFLPLPILLLDDFKALCSVTVDASNNTEEKVGEGNVTYPLASAKYNHSTASIKGLTPQYLKVYTKKSGEVSFKNVNLCNTDKKALARVRLYFDKKSKEELTKIFNGSLPSEWAVDELFKGEADPNSYTSMSYITSGGVAVIGSGGQGETAYKPGQVDWQKFKTDKRAYAFPEGHDKIFEQIAKEFNINTRMWLAQVVLETGWFRSDAFNKKKNVGGLSVPGHYRVNGRVVKAQSGQEWTDAVYRAIPNESDRPNYWVSDYKFGQSYTLEKYGNVPLTVPDRMDMRVEKAKKYGGAVCKNGYFWIFKSFEDGYRAKAYLITTSKLYGINKFKPTSVKQYYQQCEKGGYSTTAGYAASLLRTYNSLP